jgi:hypothetical protein
MTEPQPDRPGPGVDADQVRDGIAALSELAAAGVEADGEIQIAESTWAIYGHIGYDGAIVVGEYYDAAVASAVLRAAPHRRLDQDGSGP